MTTTLPGRVSLCASDVTGFRFGFLASVIESCLMAPGCWPIDVDIETSGSRGSKLRAVS
jgi:hypothetical protein